MNPLRICFCVMLTVGWAWSLPSAVNVPEPVGYNFVQAVEELPESIYNDCANKGSVSCIKHKLFAFVDKQLSKDEFNLAEGVAMVRTSGPPDAADLRGAPRALQLQDGSEQQPKDVDAMMVERVQRFLNEHSLKVNIKGSDVVNAVTRTGKSISDAVSEFMGDDEGSVEESRGKKKKKNKQLMHLFMMLKFKLIALLPFILGKIALIAGKALLLGKIALVLSLIVVLQKVLSQHKKTVTYEVVPQPHHDVHGGHDSYSSGGGADVASGGYGGSSAGGGWGRSLDAQQMAYSAQVPSQ